MIFAPKCKAPPPKSKGAVLLIFTQIQWLDIISQPHIEFRSGQPKGGPNHPPIDRHVRYAFAVWPQQRDTQHANCPACRRRSIPLGGGGGGGGHGVPLISSASRYKGYSIANKGQGTKAPPPKFICFECAPTTAYAWPQPTAYF